MVNKNELSFIQKKPYFTLQWHLTARCEQNCLHCYMREDETYEQEIKKELDYRVCIEILNDFDVTFKQWGLPTRINFTGGDPLLRPDIFNLIEQAIERNIKVGILGNPNLINNVIAKRLRNIGISSYQLSIDGLEDTHDRIRGKKGLFLDTIRAIHILEDAGIPTVAMFTLNKMNSKDLIGVIRQMAMEGVSVFDFARMVPIGSGRRLKEQIIEPEEYHALLLKVLGEYQRLYEMGCKTYFGRKDHLWYLLYQELGLLKPLPKDDLIYSGCSIGSCILTILADGTVYSCRRLPIKIGQVPQQSIKEIFISSKEHNKLRQIEKFNKCRKCNLLRHCRGCPAVAYGVNKNYYAPDPQCWKKINSK